MRKKSLRFSLYLSLMIYGLFVIVELISSMMNTNGHFGYPLDDTYIHMAMAKHFVANGVWGVAYNSFSSSTSSPLWTLLIAITYKIFGVNDWSPLILSFLFGSLIIVYCFRLIPTQNRSLKLLLIFFIILFVPLPMLTLMGMEHTLHSLFSLLLCFSAADYIVRGKFNLRIFALLVLFANLTVITRYEGILLIGVIAFIFLLKKRVLEGIVFAISSILSIIVYGLISLANGWYFLPNSVLLKGNTPLLTFSGIINFGGRLLNNMSDAPHVIVLLLLGLLCYLWLREKMGEKEKLLIVIATMITFAHLLFASVGWLFRYEAYIVLILCVILADVFSQYIYPQRSIKLDNFYDYVIVLSLAFIFLTPLVSRTLLSFVEYPIAVKNIYEQQYQMGLFIRENYVGKCIAANDVGAINYLADICTVDLFGLANMDVARDKLQNVYDKAAIDQLVHKNHVEIAIIYNIMFPDQIPDNWVEVGRWKISNNVVCASDEVSFYSTTPAVQQTISEDLTDFSPKLPPTVLQSGMYLSP